MILLILLFVFLSGCAGKKKAEKNIFFEQWKKIAEKSKGFSPSAKKTEETILREKQGDQIIASEKTEAKAETIPDPSSEPLETIEEPPPEKPLPTNKISMKMHNADIGVLLRSLARGANQNIIISENVKGKANINIENSPWNQVFISILRTYGLTYQWEGDILRVITLEDINHELKLLEASQQILFKKREDNLKALESTRKKETEKRAIEKVAPLLTRVIPVSFADAEDLKNNMAQFLTGDKKKTRGFVAVDKHTRSLIIRATQHDIDTMVSLVEVLDKPSPQILIEAHIVETSRETARELGIQWGGQYHREGGNNNYWIVPGSSLSGTETINDELSPVSGMAINFPAAISGTGLNIGYAAQSLGNYILAVQLSALQEEGKLNILSSPSITTLDNQRAVIASGKEVPYQTVDDDEVNTEFKEATLKLEVTPHVIDGNTLKMEIKTQKKEVDTTVQDNPPILTKEAETNVVLFDGQTTVIGGLSRESSAISKSGVPFLKDIPVIGYLFKGKSDSNNMEEVLIFITPHILGEKHENQQMD